MALGRVGPALVGRGEPLDLLFDAASSSSTVSRSSFRSSISARELPESASSATLTWRPCRAYSRPRERLGLHAGRSFCSCRSCWTPSWTALLSASCAERIAMHLADEVRRDLAGTEARHADLRSDPLDLHVHAGVDILRGDGQHECPLEALIFRLNRLDHCSIPQTRDPPLPPDDRDGARGGTRTPTSFDTGT